MNLLEVDIAIIGAGGAGLRAAIAAAEGDPTIKVALISKVYPMRSHTVAAEGGSAAVIEANDSLDDHFHDTVTGGDWLCDQEVVDYFVAHCPEEMIQLEHWGCPWSRKPDGHVNVRAFGGMKNKRTWFAADKSGFHILHTLFQTSIKYPSIRRLDEYFCVDLIVDEGRCQGVVAIEIATGDFMLVVARAVIIASGGAGRVFLHNTNGGIVTGDGMAMAYRHGVPLRDMEFMQYHPTCMPGTGLLFTEGCRGEGGILVNKDGYRYLQDYGLGPVDPWPRNKAMELGPRDRISQAFWHEERKGRTVTTPHGEAVYLDLRHLGARKLRERLPQICELAQHFLGVDPTEKPITVRPAVHYTMGGILVNIDTAAPLPGLFAAGECASAGIHGANRLGSNSLAELGVFGKVAGIKAAAYAKSAITAPTATLERQARDAEKRALSLIVAEGGSDRPAELRDKMLSTMDSGCGIYRDAAGMHATCETIADLKERYRNLRLDDRSRIWNTEWLSAIELGYQLDVAEAIAHSALNRRESRGAHQRLDGFNTRNDAEFLKHTLAYYRPDGPPRVGFGPVTITRLPPGKRVYGGEAEHMQEASKEASHAA